MTDPLDTVRQQLTALESIDMGPVPVAGENSGETPDPEDADQPDDSWMPDPEAAFMPPGGTPPDGSEPPPEAICGAFPLNDIGNGMRFNKYFGANVLSVPRVGWFTWAGFKWAKDDDRIAIRTLAQQVSALMLKEVEFLVLEPWEKERLDALPAVRAEAELLQARADKTADDDAQLKILWAKVQRGEETKKLVAKRRSEYRTFAKSTGNTAKIDAMMKEAEPSLTRMLDDLDADDLAVNTESGTLRFDCDRSVIEDGGSPVATFRLDPHDRTDLLTKCMPVVHDPVAKAPRFEAFLSRIQPDAEMRRFLQRSFGLAMTGRVEQRIWFLFGHGANGKSVLVDLMARMLGDYAATAKIESLTGQSKRGGADATPDLIPLMGARMVRASEPEQGERLKEGTIKELTGGEPILVRALHSDFVEVKPDFKLFISGNHKPEIRGTDDGIWRRVLLIPFDVQIPEGERDPDLGKKLFLEAPGILNWMIDGLLDYLERGLQIPKQVQDATKEYREESDPVGVFLDACCEVTGSAAAFSRSAELTDAFNFWLTERGESQWKGRTFQLRLKDKAERWRDPRTGNTFSAAKRSVSGYQGLELTDLFRRRMEDAISRGTWKRAAASTGTDSPDPQSDY
jgi:putative DNA primase/helicase